MRNIIYGDIPEFEEILEFLEIMQEEIHGLEYQRYCQLRHKE